MFTKSNACLVTETMTFTMAAEKMETACEDIYCLRNWIYSNFDVLLLLILQEEKNSGPKSLKEEMF